MKHLEEVIINYDKKLTKAELEIERLKEELETEKDISDGMLETINKAKTAINFCHNLNPDSDDVNYIAPEIYEDLLSILEGNYEVEILDYINKEEEKKIEKLDFKEEIDCGYLKMKIYSNQYNHDMSKSDCIIAKKINEIIDYINKGE